MPYFLFALYAVGFLLVIVKAPLYKKSGLPAWVLVCFFSLKVIIGLGINHYYGQRYEDKKFADVYKFFDDGQILYEIGLENPLAFVKIFTGIDDENPKEIPQLLQLKNWFPQDSRYLEVINYKDSNVFSTQKTLIRINALLCFFSLGNIATHTLVFCFLSFIGLILIYRTFISFQPNRKILLALIVFLCPSVLIWSSSLFKESLIFLGLGIFIFSLLEPKRLNLILGGLLILLFSATHVFCIAVLVSLLYYLYLKNKMLSLLVMALMAISGIILCKTPYNPLEIVASKMNQQHKIGKGGYYFLQVEKQEQFYVSETEFNRILPKQQLENGHKTRFYYLPSVLKVQRYADGKTSPQSSPLGNKNGWYYKQLHYIPAATYLPGPDLQPTFKSFLFFLPQGIKNTFWEPSVFKAKSVIHFVFGLENLLVILVVFFTAWLLVKKRVRKIVFPFLVFAVLLMTLIAYTSPIYGNIIRYKSPSVLLFLLCFIILLPSKQEASNRKTTF